MQSADRGTNPPADWSPPALVPEAATVKTQSAWPHAGTATFDPKRKLPQRADTVEKPRKMRVTKISVSREHRSQ
jgi:hypothetical protein